MGQFADDQTTFRVSPQESKVDLVQCIQHALCVLLVPQDFKRSEVRKESCFHRPTYLSAFSWRRMKFRANITKILRFGKSNKEKKGEMGFDFAMQSSFLLAPICGYWLLGWIRQQKIATL